MAEMRHLENRHEVIFSADGGPIGRIQWHVIPELPATLQGVRIPSAILKSFFAIFYFFCFFNAVWALTGGGFRVVSDTLVKSTLDKCIDGVCDAIIYSPNYMPSEENENQGP